MGRAEFRILSTLFSQDAPIDVWQDRVEMVRPKSSDLDTIGYVLSRAGRYDALVLDGSGHRDQVIAALVALRRRRPAVVIADSTWTAGDNPLERTVHRIGIRMIDGPRTTFCVGSTFEVDSFERTWGLIRGQTYFTPWPATIKHQNPRALTSDSGRVFAGGNSLRDFEPLIAAAPSISASIDIVSGTLTADQLHRCPSNVTAGPLPHAAYEQLLFAASVVVVPLQVRNDRASGQTTYTNAMALGKAVVVTDAPGVRDYVVDGTTGVIVAPGDPDALARAVQRLIDDPSERTRLGTAAAQYASTHLTIPRYAEAVLRATDLTLARL